MPESGGFGMESLIPALGYLKRYVASVDTHAWVITTSKYQIERTPKNKTATSRTAQANLDSLFKFPRGRLDRFAQRSICRLGQLSPRIYCVLSGNPGLVVKSTDGLVGFHVS